MMLLTRKRDASDEDHVEGVLTVVWMRFNRTSYWRRPLIQSPKGGQFPRSHHREVDSSLRNMKMKYIQCNTFILLLTCEIN